MPSNIRARFWLSFGSFVAAIAAARLIAHAAQASTLTIPVSGPAAAVRCEYFADLNAAGGVIDWGRLAVQPGAVVINTAPLDKPSTLLKKAFIYCPGFEISVLMGQSIPGPQAQLAPISPAPLPGVQVNGHVAFPTAEQPVDGRVEVLHSASWVLEHYGTWDGSVPQFRIASVPLRADGTFVVEVPDFGKDRWVSQFRDQGEFQFSAVVGRVVYRLRPPAELTKNERFGVMLPPGRTRIDASFTAVRWR